jgi:hypothetical protein
MRNGVCLAWIIFICVFNHLRADTTHLALKRQIDQNLFSNPALAMQAARSYYFLGIRESRLDWQNKGIYTLAVAHDVMGHLDSAFYFYQMSWQRGIDQKDLKLQADALNGLSIISNAGADPEQALFYINKALLIRIELKDSVGIANSLNNMAAIGRLWAICIKP